VWDPWTETRSSARERILEEISEHLDRQLIEIEMAALERGDVPTPLLKGGTKHFEWLALYQVRRLSYEKIATGAGVTVPAVRQAILECAHRVDIQLREPHRAGRPAGRKRPTARTVKVPMRRREIV
jgi:hypothetical protein